MSSETTSANRRAIASEGNEPMTVPPNEKLQMDIARARELIGASAGASLGDVDAGAPDDPVTLSEALDALDALQESASTLAGPLYVATSDVERCTWVALGTSEDDARESLARGFNAAPHYGADATLQRMTADELNEYAGIGVTRLDYVGQAGRDGEPITETKPTRTR